jgi:hypothetical protein
VFLFHICRRGWEPTRVKPFCYSRPCSEGRLLSLLVNIRLGWKYLTMTNATGYFNRQVIKPANFFSLQGGIRTLNLRITSRLFYHCATDIQGRKSFVVQSPGLWLPPGDKNGNASISQLRIQIFYSTRLCFLLTLSDKSYQNAIISQF